MISQITYLATILVFAGSAVVLEFLFGYRWLKKYLRVIRLAVIVSLLMTVAGDNIAISWRTWVYHPERFSAIYILGVPLETYLFATFCSIAIAGAALRWADLEEEGRPLIKGTLEIVMRKLKRNSFPL